MSAHLEFAWDHGLLVHPPPNRHCASLRLGPEGVDVLYGSVAPVRLPWVVYGKVGSQLDGANDPDAWVVTNWTAGRAGPFGVGVQVSGAFEQASQAIIGPTVGRWRRYDSAMSNHLHGRRIPIVVGSSVFTAANAERDTLTVLCRVLADHEPWRGRLGDQDRVARLVTDLQSGLRRAAPHRSGKTRDQVDIIAAMRSCGFEWRYGRPLDIRERPDLDHLSDLTIAALEDNPYRVGRATDRQLVVRTIRRTYYDVEPWPLAALTDE